MVVDAGKKLLGPRAVASARLRLFYRDEILSSGQDKGSLLV
jgi:hypothetical protein